MPKIIYRTQVSLDGLIEMPGEPPDWVIVDEELFRFLNDLEHQLGGYLWGRKMYENNRALWEAATVETMGADGMAFMQMVKQLPKIVFSSTLEQVDASATLERGDPVEVVSRLKAQPGPDFSTGGIQLANTLIQAGLVDELHIFVQPILLGAGKSLYPALIERVRLKLAESRVFGSGVIYLRYQIKTE